MRISSRKKEREDLGEKQFCEEEENLFDTFLLRFYTVGSDGSTTLAFNATSIQNAVILGLFTLVLGALVLPLFGLSLGSLFGAESTGSGYGSQYGYSEPSYGSGNMIKVFFF